MPSVRLTDISLRSLARPERGQVDYWDQLLPCFGCRVSQGGTKTFIVKKDNRRLTIGRFPVMRSRRRELKRNELCWPNIHSASFVPARFPPPPLLRNF